jgi:phage terminase large subunit
MGEKGFYDMNADVYDELNIKNDYWANQYRVYGLGLLGTLEGQIFKHFKHVNSLPEGKSVYGLDFGYEHDPTALVEVKKWKGEIYGRLLYYETGYRSKNMIEFLYLHGVGPNDPIICDHDKTAVRDLRDHGFLAFYADKYKGSVKDGIQALQDVPVNITHDSHDLIFEEENYYWEMKDGKPTGEPIDANNHGCDGLRYAHSYIKDPTNPHFMKQWKDRRGGRRRVY